MRHIPMLSRLGQRDELGGGHRLAAWMRLQSQQQRPVVRPPEPVRGPHDQIGQPDPATVRRPQSLCHPVPVPDPEQELTAGALEVEPLELRGQILGGQTVAAQGTPRLDLPGHRDRRVQPLAERGIGTFISRTSR